MNNIKSKENNSSNKENNKNRIFYVAKYILHNTGPVFIWKLHKLLYYSYVWYLTFTGKKLFNNDFYAYGCGPVCIELINYLKNNINTKNKYIISENEFINYDYNNTNILTEKEKNIILKVLKEYKDMEPYQLRGLARAETPWINAFNDKNNRVIKTKDIVKYYSHL